MGAEKENENTLERIHREHEELRALLGEIHKVLVRRLESVAGVTEKLADLNEQLETHFNEEEVGGFFDQVIDQAPRLSDRTEALRDEHTQLLKTVRRIHERARSAPASDDWWDSVSNEFHDFSKELMEHEHKENEVLQDAYAEDIGAAD